MHRVQWIVLRWIVVSLLLPEFLNPACQQLMAQGFGNQGGGNQGGGQGGQPFPGGILIRPDGLISSITPRNSHKGAKSGSRKPATEEPGKQRAVSLARLEQTIRQQLDSGSDLSSEMLFFAGLTEIERVIVVENGSDVLLCGQAEEFRPSDNGRMCGTSSGRPVLCLEDLIVALRQSGNASIGCSIDPVADRLAASQEWLRKNSAPATRAVAQARLQRMVELQGNWNITTFGVPETCRLCLAMVEADYLMKRLSIGTQSSGVRGFRSSLSLAGPGDNMMRRWWFAPAYTELTSNPAGTEFHLGGPRVQLFAREELMDKEGHLQDADFQQASSEEFASLFNEKLPELVSRFPVFGDLQNIFDVLITAALIQNLQQRGLVSWDADVFTDEALLPLPAYPVPRESAPMLNVRMSGGSLIIGAFSGGVVIRPNLVLSQLRDETPLAAGSSTVTIPSEDRWWWDLQD